MFSSGFFLPALLWLAQEATSHPACKPGMNSNAMTGKAIYVLTNEKANGVLAIPIGQDGTLSKGKVTMTGGAGSVAVDAEGKPATPDALISQSALTIAGNNIFAVNAGSNTLSMLRVSRSDPTKLQMVGKPVQVPGEFPNTVAASAKNGVVCVGSTGAKAGVSCSSFSRQGLGAMDELRTIDLGQTTPPAGPTNTLSQVLFSEDESMLFTMVKGDPAVNNTGFISVANVEMNNGVAAVSKQDARSSPEGTAVLFGSQVIPGTSKVFATDASFGAAILDVDPNNCEATTAAKGAVDGQTATCWVAISPATKSAFVTDVGRNRVVEMSLEDASVVSELDLTCNGDPGLIDLAASGNFLYALSPGNGTTQAAVTVLDVSGGSGSAKMVQHFELAGMASNTAMGMKVICTICGIALRRSEGWKTDVVALSGPHWPQLLESPSSLRVNDDQVSRHATKPDYQHPSLILLPQEQKIYPHATYELNKRSDKPSEWEGIMFVGLHAACEDLANRVMKKSYKARLSHFTPKVPENKPGLPFSVGLGRYFVPSRSIQLYGYYEDSWWNEDPVSIPNLTTLLIANLKPEKDVSGKLPKTLTGFQKRLECLPRELKDLIYSFLHRDHLPLDCTYIMPQSMWKQVFFQVPFLWDLDEKEIHDKTSAGDFNVQNWDWEKITRQVVTPPEIPRQDSIGGGGGAWSFHKVGLNVPGGFTNRRRIWQILEEMYPNDVRH
ncbi:hypothetical protein FPRO05_08268 [Fusarium proliferatum]|uniref:Uncharacterized protein n=1 Tax=Gibberella intermedia TaxID=948311 RepID=A0A365NJ30_GIBIN|nr:hypothetical protein FPRO05_08268 [Fusarium proliferatum]